MRAWRVRRPGPVTGRPLELDAVAAVPEPGAGELLVAVRACGVCRTDLHVTEGDLPMHRPHLTPGHEVVGEVVALGDGAIGFAPGDRVGIAWLRRTCGHCAYCVRGHDNLCPDSRYTGWDADGGHAEFATVPASFALRTAGPFGVLQHTSRRPGVPGIRRPPPHRRVRGGLSTRSGGPR